MPTSEPTVGRIGALARRLVGTNAAIAAVCLAAIGLMWIAVIAQARFERREAVAAAIERNSNLAVAFEEFIVRTIDGADAVARYVKREYARTGAGIDIPGLIADRTVDAGAFAAISIVDERGNLVATSYGRVPGGPLNAADRPHFTVHVAGDTGKVFVGQPIMSRLTGKSTIPISRRINKPDGSFGGIVSVQIEPTRFTEFYGDATLRPGDVIALIGLDGIIRARRVGRQVSSGESLASGRLMTEQQAHPSGAYLAPGRFDSIPRYYSYRTLRDYPLLVTVGVAEQDVLLPSSQRRARNFVGTGLISGVMAFFAALLITALERKKRTVVMLKQTMDDLNAVHGRLAEQASLLDKAQDAIVVRDLAHRITYWNKSAERLYGWTAAEILGTRARDLQTDVAVFDEAMRKVVEHGDWVGELSQTRKGGHPIIVESRWTLVKDEAGRAAAVLVINTDITERRKLEHQFLRAQRLESIGTLAGGIAHDLNNVLTPIMVAIGLLREKEDDPARLDILSTL
ncbi:MAG TPA: PAS domain S-box protein, partial [Vicinamibacterales bacterium]